MQQRKSLHMHSNGMGHGMNSTADSLVSVMNRPRAGNFTTTNQTNGQKKIDDGDRKTVSDGRI